MKPVLFVVALLVAASAIGAATGVPFISSAVTAQSFTSRWVSDQALTGSMPTTSDTGLTVDGPTAVRPYVCANAGQTLSGAGTINVFFIDPYESVVMRNPGLDLSVSVTSTSCQGAACQCQVFPDMLVKGGAGKMRLVPSGVTVSGGTTVRVGLIGGTK